MNRSCRRAVGPLAIVCLLTLAGCGGGKSSDSSSRGSSSSPGPSSSSSSSVAAHSVTRSVAKLVPAAIKTKGVLTVAIDPNDAPNEFLGPGRAVVGMDPDLIEALAGVMGLKINVVRQPVAGIIPGVVAGRFDVGASSLTDTDAGEKQVDFVDYFATGESFFNVGTGGIAVSGLSSLCGHSVSVVEGTIEQSALNTQSIKCQRAVERPITILVYPSQEAADQALASGRAQVAFADSAVAAYRVRQSNAQFKLIGPTIPSGSYGLAVRRKSGLTKPLLAALKVLINDGTYNQILNQWAVQSGAINTPRIDGATS